MRSKNRTEERRKQGGVDRTLRKIMKCLCSGEQLRGADEMVRSSESLATKDFTASGYSSRLAEVDQKPDTGNIEEAEFSLRESGCLNYEVSSFGFHILQLCVCFKISSLFRSH